jgi:hypothetical protein
MYDEENLYFAAEVQDDIPAIMVDPFSWRSDVVELYIANYDVGEMNAYHDPSVGKGVIADSAKVQLAFYYNGDEDTTEAWTYDPAAGSLKSDNTVFAGALGADGESWTLEGKINLMEFNDIIDPTGEALFDFAGYIGCFLPCTHSIYDVDEYVEYDFDGYQCSISAGPPHNGPGQNTWYGIEVVGTNLLEELDTLWDTWSGVETVKLDRIPQTYQLRQNYPNPFNPVTTIEFDLVSAGTVNLNIFNVRGELVRNLIEGEFKSPGVYTARVDLSDSPSGVYFYVLEQGGSKLVQKMMLMK